MKLFITFTLLFCISALFSQSDYESEIISYQNEMNKFYSDTAISPLLKEDLANFKSLDFFPINDKYRIKAKFIKKFNPITVTLKTSTDRAPKYKVFGELHFELEGKQIKINVYQSDKISENEEYRDHLFLPFTDLTSDELSYGGGRYIDLKIPEGDLIIIDFNKSYNPYCAYNHKYSCVIPPAENFIDFKIKAGVMKYKEKH